MLMLFRISSAWLTKGAPADVTKLGFCLRRRLCHDRFKSPLLILVISMLRMCKAATKVCPSSVLNRNQLLDLTFTKWDLHEYWQQIGKTQISRSILLQCRTGKSLITHLFITGGEK